MKELKLADYHLWLKNRYGIQYQVNYLARQVKLTQDYVNHQRIAHQFRKKWKSQQVDNTIKDLPM